MTNSLYAESHSELSTNAVINVSYNPSDQGVPMANFRSSTLLTGDVSYTEVSTCMQPLSRPFSAPLYSHRKM
jgi:hypothetical protein